MIAELIDGRALAARVVDQVKAAMASLPRVPGLAVILAGDDPASHVYVNSKARLAQEIGFAAEVIRLPADETLVSVMRLDAEEDNGEDAEVVDANAPAGDDGSSEVEPAGTDE